MTSSKTLVTRLLPSFALAAALLIGCAADYELEETYLRHGESTLHRPEIGNVWHGYELCTGTLVAPNVVLTAAHCVDYQTGPVEAAVFHIRIGGDKFVGSPVVESISFSEPHHPLTLAANAHKDLALLRLESPIASDVARPAVIASSAVASGDTVSFFGYGRSGSGPACILNQNNDIVKRVHTAVWGDSLSETCPGDSGGPVVRGLADGRGAIVATVSGGVALGMVDVFGNPVRHRASLQAWIDFWRQEPE